MKGPVERALRRRLRDGEVVSRRAAVREHGVIAGVILDGLCRQGIVERDGDAYAPKLRVVPEETIQRVNARLRELPGTPAPTSESLAAAERRRLQREALRVALDAAKTPAERERVIRQSRLGAMADSALAALPSIAGELDDADLGEAFGIELEGA